MQIEIFDIDTEKLWGPVDNEEGILLYSLVRCIRPEVCIETGTGYSTFFIAQGLNDNEQGILHSITINEEQAKFCCDLLHEMGFDKQVNIHLGNSTDLLCEVLESLRGINFAFLDSDHSWKHISKELNIVYHWLSLQGIIVCHDSIENPQVGRVCQEFATQKSLNLIQIKTRRGIDVIS